MSFLDKAVKATAKKANQLAEKAKADAKRKKEEEKLRIEENERKFRESFPFKRMYCIKKETTQKPEYWEKVSQGAYIITDENEKPVYIANEGFWLGNYCFKLTDSAKKTVGYVRKHLFNLSGFGVKDRTGCTLWFADDSFSARLLTYKSDNERKYECEEGYISVKIESKDKFGREKTLKISNKKTNKNFSKIYTIRASEGFSSDRVVIGFNDEKDSALSALIAVAINVIRHESY